MKCEKNLRFIKFLEKKWILNEKSRFCKFVINYDNFDKIKRILRNVKKGWILSNFKKKWTSQAIVENVWKLIKMLMKY